MLSISEFDDISSEKSRRNFLTVFPSIVLPMFLAVVDQTIIATALPAIATSLGDVDHLSWIIVSYLVSATIAAPVYGRLGDVLGRRHLMFFALAIFVSASVLCAVSQSIAMLTVARILQGAGGGGLMTLSQALVGEAIPPRERARYQGYLAAIGVSSSAFGPVAGGFLTEHLGWQSVFLINVPLGVIAGLLTLRLPDRRGIGQKFTFDSLGLFLFTGFIAATFIMLEQACQLGAGSWSQTVGLAAVAIVVLLLFIWREKRASFPLLPISLLKHPAIWRSDALAACHGAMQLSLITFLPFYFRMTYGTSASSMGLLLLPLTVGVGSGSLITGRIIDRLGRTAIFPSWGLACAVAILLTAALFGPLLSANQIAWVFGLVSLCMGTVMGVVQLTVQLASGANHLGSGAASVQLSRSLGSAIGVAVVGAVLFVTVALASPEASEAFARILQRGPDALSSLDAAQQSAIQSAVGLAFRNAFLCVAAFGTMAMGLAWSLPIRRI